MYDRVLPVFLQAQAGKLGERKKLLKSVRVVGVTCLSSMNAALENQTFSVVVLDECSQVSNLLSHSTHQSKVILRESW